MVNAPGYKFRREDPAADEREGGDRGTTRESLVCCLCARKYQAADLLPHMEECRRQRVREYRALPPPYDATQVLRPSTLLARNLLPRVPGGHASLATVSHFNKAALEVYGAQALSCEGCGMHWSPDQADAFVAHVAGCAQSRPEAPPPIARVASPPRRVHRRPPIKPVVESPSPVRTHQSRQLHPSIVNGGGYRADDPDNYRSRHGHHDGPSRDFDPEQASALERERRLRKEEAERRRRLEAERAALEHEKHALADRLSAGEVRAARAEGHARDLAEELDAARRRAHGRLEAAEEQCARLGARLDAAEGARGAAEQRALRLARALDAALAQGARDADAVRQGAQSAAQHAAARAMELARERRADAEAAARAACAERDAARREASEARRELAALASATDKERVRWLERMDCERRAQGEERRAREAKLGSVRAAERRACVRAESALALAEEAALALAAERAAHAAALAEAVRAAAAEGAAKGAAQAQAQAQAQAAAEVAAAVGALSLRLREVEGAGAAQEVTLGLLKTDLEATQSRLGALAAERASLEAQVAQAEGHHARWEAASERWAVERRDLDAAAAEAIVRGEELERLELRLAAERRRLSEAEEERARGEAARLALVHEVEALTAAEAEAARGREHIAGEAGRALAHRDGRHPKGARGRLALAPRQPLRVGAPGPGRGAGRPS